MRPSVPRGPLLLPRVALRLSTVHDPVITPKTVVLRSLFAHRADPGGAKLSPPPPKPRWLRRVAERRVASASPQSPKASIGPAIADLRRAAAATKCARLAARFADLAGPGAAPLGAALHVRSFAFAASSWCTLGRLERGSRGDRALASATGPSRGSRSTKPSK